MYLFGGQIIYFWMVWGGVNDHITLNYVEIELDIHRYAIERILHTSVHQNRACIAFSIA